MDLERRVDRYERLVRDRLLSRITERNVRRHLARLSPQLPAVRVVFDQTGMMPRDLLLERHGDGFIIHYDVEASPFFVSCAQHFVRAYVYWMMQSDRSVTSIALTGADGDAPSLARFTPCASRREQVALPDPHFFDSRGYRTQRELAAAALPWAERSDALVWRGGGNGSGRLSFEQADLMDPTVLARLRMVGLLKDAPGTDAKLVELQQDNGSYQATARRLGYLADRIDQESWLTRKYAIDIDGTVNTWANLLIRMLYGCCVLKVQSQFGFRQWYYDRLVPYEHYIPVKADMSDLLDQWEWAKTNDGRAAEIARNGANLARTITFEQAAAEAAVLIEANWR